MGVSLIEKGDGGINDRLGGGGGSWGYQGTDRIEPVGLGGLRATGEVTSDQATNRVFNNLLVYDVDTSCW